MVSGPAHAEGRRADVGCESLVDIGHDDAPRSGDQNSGSAHQQHRRCERRAAKSRQQVQQQRADRCDQRADYHEESAPPDALGKQAGTNLAKTQQRVRSHQSQRDLRAVSDAKLVGVWIGFGAGIDKQYFIVRKVAGGLRGMACGRCDNPYTMAALDDFQVKGDTLTFNILHEDWGPGSLPNHNQVMAHVAKNEMRISTMPDNVAAGTASVPGFKVEASLMGPIAAQATQP